jgi:hypothetical protein
MMSRLQHRSVANGEVVEPMTKTSPGQTSLNQTFDPLPDPDPEPAPQAVPAPDLEPTPEPIPQPEPIPLGDPSPEPDPAPEPAPTAPEPAPDPEPISPVGPEPDMTIDCSRLVSELVASEQNGLPPSPVEETPAARVTTPVLEILDRSTLLSLEALESAAASELPFQSAAEEKDPEPPSNKPQSPSRDMPQPAPLTPVESSFSLSGGEVVPSGIALLLLCALSPF